MKTRQKGSTIDERWLSPENIAAINAILASDQRVELIPTKRGVMVYRVRREEIKSEYRSPL